MLKVLIVHNAYQSHLCGGEDIVVLQEAQALKKALGDQNVFQYSACNDNIKFFKLMRNIWGDKHHQIQIFKLVKKHNIDIVHVHNFFPLLTPSVFKGAKKAGATVIQTLHNFRWRCLSGIFYRNEKGICEKCIKKSWGWPAIIHRCYRQSRLQSLAGTLAFAWYHFKRATCYIDAYFVLSPFQFKKMGEMLPEGKLFLKPNGILLSENTYPVALKKDFLFVGRLEASKGIELLLSIWKTLPPHFHLNIIGDGELGCSLKKQYQQPNIVFLGQKSKPEVLERMEKSKYTLQMSLWYETFGLTIIESFSKATPVIGFNIGTRADLIQSGHNGFLCEPKELRNTLITADKYADYETMSHNASIAANLYSIETIIQKQILLYQHCKNVS